MSDAPNLKNWDIFVKKYGGKKEYKSNKYLLFHFNQGMYGLLGASYHKLLFKKYKKQVLLIK